MKQIFAALCTAAIMVQPAWAATFEDMFPQYVADMDAETQAMVAGMDFQQGEIDLGNGLATVSVPQGYYFLAPKDARRVLEQFWGNPADPDVLGMLFPVDITPLHSGGWGLTYHFDAIGYVSDVDAEGYDYAELLTEMQRDTLADNDWRQSQGYDSIELVGWAEPPRYDAAERVLYWAKELSFSDSDFNTLNFNIRRLGRKGVLVQNFVATMDSLPEVKQDLAAVIAMTRYQDGNRYVDFDPDLDKVAAVGIGGLIAGKVLAKSGFLAVALLMLKKFWFVLFVPLIWLKGLLFGRRGSGGDSA